MPCQGGGETEERVGSTGQAGQNRRRGGAEPEAENRNLRQIARRGCDILSMEALAKLRFARAVFRIQNSGFRMNSNRTVSPPAHCNILTTDFRLLNTSMPQLRQEFNMGLYGNGFDAFRLLCQGPGSRVARLCKRPRIRILSTTLAIARKRSRKGMPVGRTGRVRAAGRRSRAGKRAKAGSSANPRVHVRRSRSASRMEFAGKRAQAEDFASRMLRANRRGIGKRAARADSGSRMACASPTGRAGKREQAEDSAGRRARVRRAANGRRRAAAGGRCGGSPANGGRMTNRGVLRVAGNH